MVNDNVGSPSQLISAWKYTIILSYWLDYTMLISKFILQQHINEKQYRSDCVLVFRLSPLSLTHSLYRQIYLVH